MVDLAVLGLLKQGPLHGYELKRRLVDLGLLRVSFGSLYPALRRLNRDGHVEIVEGTGRRKVYAITAAGEHRFGELLRGTAPDREEERTFRVRVAFLRYLEPEARLELLERRRALLRARVAKTKQAITATASRTRQRVDRYMLSLMEHGARLAEADIAWLDGLIKDEQAELPPAIAPRTGKRKRKKRKRATPAAAATGTRRSQLPTRRETPAHG